jgi:hypothetical protein
MQKKITPGMPTAKNAIRQQQLNKISCRSRDGGHDAP